MPGESHGLKSLVSYSPWGCKESSTAEKLTLHRQARGPVSGIKLGEKTGSTDAESKTERNKTDGPGSQKVPGTESKAWDKDNHLG